MCTCIWNGGASFRILGVKINWLCMIFWAHFNVAMGVFLLSR